MDETGGTGDVSVVQEEKTFEWKVDDFLELTSYEVDSPEFRFFDESWRMTIFPFNEERYVGLDVYPMALPDNLTVTMKLGFKTVNGKSDFKDTSTTFIEEEYYAFARPQLISRSELIRRHSELLPSGTLTVICILKKSGPNVVNGVSVLQQQFGKTLQNEIFSDVVLKVGHQEFKAHRFVLGSRSPVLLAMLTHDTKEKNTGVVDIKDADPKTFSDFLHYLYTGSEEFISSDNVVELFTTADKYQVGDLKKSCLDYMITNITVDNFCDILSLSLMHVEKNLTDACSEFFVENSLPILKTPKWLMFVAKYPVACTELTIKLSESITDIEN